MSEIYGVIPAKVDSEPNELGQVRIRMDWVSGSGETYWASIATLMAGGNRGVWFMPEIGDDVLVAFDQGKADHPYIVGFLWNGQDRPPTVDRQLRVIQSVNGHKIEIFDPLPQDGDGGYIRLSDTHGNMIQLSNAEIIINSLSAIRIEAPNVFIKGRPVVPLKTSI